MHGGGHERGFRSGTLATHQIVGMGEAFRLARLEMAEENARIGALRDRLLAQLQLLVGVGTAMTIDALAADGQHFGGSIVPGLRLMREAMTRAAPNVDWHEGAYCTDFASDTASALESGIWCALAGSVAAQLGTPARRDALLVMRGLAAYLDAGVAQSRALSD